MHYNFLFNGCSYTFGSELEGINNDLDHQRTHRFSHLVAENYNKTYDNISISGSSNDSIVRRTIEWFENGNTCDLAIIQFTLVSRLEYINPLQNKKIDICPGILKSSRLMNDDFTKHSVKSYYRDVYNITYGFYNFYKNLFILEQYFEKNNIKHYFMKIRKIKISVDNQIVLWKSMCRNKYTDIVSISGDILSRDDNTHDYCPCLKDSNNEYLTGKHPSEIGHKKIAEYLIKEIDNAYFV
jgi:hypothetical protein